MHKVIQTEKIIKNECIVLQFINLLQFCPATVGTQKHISELNLSGWAVSLQMMVAMTISLASHNDHAHLQSPALKKKTSISVKLSIFQERLCSENCKIGNTFYNKNILL